MTNRIFNQQDFIDLEDSSSGLDLLAEPNRIILAKDPKSLVSNIDSNMRQLLMPSGLLDSYGLEPFNPININKRARSETIDNALAALYFLVNGEETKAKVIYRHYLTLLPLIFTTGTGQVPDWINLKDQTVGVTQALSTAYLLYSVSYYMSATQNTEFRQLALFCAQQIIDLKSLTSNLIKDNYTTDKCSSEANIVAYLGLKLLLPFTNDSDIIDFTESLKVSISTDLGLKDNTSSISFSSDSLVFLGLFALNIGDKFLLSSVKTFIKDHYINPDDRIIGLGNDLLDVKSTLLGSILYFRLDQKSFSNAFNTSMIEKYLAEGSFLSTNKHSSMQLSLLFLLLNQVILDDFIVGELFR
jgi:hypothetical protein